MTKLSVNINKVANHCVMLAGGNNPDVEKSGVGLRGFRGRRDYGSSSSR